MATAAATTTAIPTLLKLLSLFITSMGSANLLLGTRVIGGTSTLFPAKNQATALAESQIRYMGGVFAGAGPILWWISRDVEGRLFPLGCLCGGIFVGGLGRALAARLHGYGKENARWAMWAELVGPVALWVYGRGKGVW